MHVLSLRSLPSDSRPGIAALPAYPFDTIIIPTHLFLKEKEET